MTLLQSFDLNDGNAAAEVKSRAGQSFILTQKASITSVKFRLSKSVSPTGNIVAEIWAHTGTFGTNGVPTGSALATSNPVDAATLPTWYTSSLFEFTFSTPYEINVLPYFLICAHTSSDPNFVMLHGQTDVSAHAGNGVRYLSGAWVVGATDYDFYLYGTYLGGSITGVQSITGISSIQF